MANLRRDASKERFWRDVLRRFAASGLSVRAFCKRERLTESTFYAWRRTIGERSRAGDSGPAFVPAVMTAQPRSESSIAIELALSSRVSLPKRALGSLLSHGPTFGEQAIAARSPS